MNYKAGGKHWVLDSGCTQHMTSYVKMFTSLDEDVGDHEHVTFGDNSKGRVVGLGKVTITKDLSISIVLLVESVSFNLLSIAQLCDLGLICTFSDSEVIVTSKEDKTLIFKGFRHGNIYLVDFSSNEASLATCFFLQELHGLALASPYCSYWDEPTQEGLQERNGGWCQGCYI